MHKIRFRPGHRPDPTEELTAHPQTLAGFKGSYLRKEGETGNREEGERKEKQGWKKPRFFRKVFRFLGFLRFLRFF